jgi:hypothetical protein
MSPDNQWPIVRVTIGEDGMPVRTALYAPGLPPGDHDLYCEPSKEMAEIRAAYEVVPDATGEVPIEPHARPADERTLWECVQCKDFNPLERPYCSYCGKKRALNRPAEST